MPSRTTININLLKEDIGRSPFIKATAGNIAKQRVEQQKEKLIDKFEEHPITREIESGPRGENISGTILGIPGNLFSFIGFNEGENPIENIREVLTKESRIVKIQKARRALFKVTITVPDKNEIFKATPIPWATGRSWVDGIERGISGFGYYFYSKRGFEQSASGHAIQLKEKIRNGRFSNTKYISELLNNFYKSL